MAIGYCDPTSQTERLRLVVLRALLRTVRGREVPTPSAVAWVELEIQHGLREPVVALEGIAIVFVTEQDVAWKEGGSK